MREAAGTNQEPWLTRMADNETPTLPRSLPWPLGEKRLDPSPGPYARAWRRRDEEEALLSSLPGEEGKGKRACADLPPLPLYREIHIQGSSSSAEAELGFHSHSREAAFTPEEQGSSASRPQTLFRPALKAACLKQG